MFLFDMLFGKKGGTDQAAAARPPAAQAAPVAQAAPGTGIRHDPRLITSLLEDHRLLLEVYGAIDNARRFNDLLGVQTKLDQFRMMLQDHLLKENVRLYVYLEHALRGDPASHQLMHEFRHEMDDIGRVVVGFLGKYRQIGAHPELAAEFSRDFAAIGEALVARIRREESTLYPMYDVQP